jgi:hypothetical protein
MKKANQAVFFRLQEFNECASYLLESSREGSDSFGHGFRLLGDEGVAGGGDYDDGDAIAERGFQYAGKFARGDGVVFGLQIEDGRGTAGEPLIDRRGARGGIFRFFRFGVPASQPDARIVARSKECELQIAQAVGLRERQVSAFINRFAHFGRNGRLLNTGRNFPSRSCGQHDPAHQIGPVGRQRAGDEVAVGVAHNEAWPTTTAGPLRSCSITTAMSAAKSCSVKPVMGPLLAPMPRG